MIAVRGLVQRYGEQEALRLSEWKVAAGERWLVLGPSGCGKTTLLHVLAGLVRPTEGNVEIGGQNVSSLSGTALDRWRASTVGIVLQALHLVKHLSVRDNLRLAQYLAQAPQDDARVADTLGALGVAAKGARRPGELSQGEQQRVAIARAVVNRPKLVLADEPTANLDDAAAAVVVELLTEQAARHGATLVVATHDARVKDKFREKARALNLATLSASYLRARPLNTALSVLLLALGVATIVLLLLVVGQAEERMHRDARGIDLVVGAKGSPMQLMLSGIYHLDAPTGNIPLASAQQLAKHRMVKKAIPLALGDSWRGYRIVGAPRAYAEHYEAKVQGRFYDKPMEAVLGAEVAARTGMGVGGSFKGAHGIGSEGGEEHADAYAVVGVLERTGAVIDRLVLTGIESVWQVHEEHQGPQDAADRKALEAAREVTVVLVQYASPLAAAMLPRQVNSQSELQAASPAYETARLFSIVGVGVEALRAFAAVLILAAGLSVFIALYTALEERRYDLAIMRTLGASPGKLFGLLMIEGIALSFLGAVLGLLLGHALAAALGAWLESQHHYAVTGLQWRPEELWVFAVALGVGWIAAFVPAWRAYRTDVSRTLAQG